MIRRSATITVGILAVLWTAGIASAAGTPTPIPTAVATPASHPSPVGLVMGQQAPWSGVLYHEEDIKLLLKAASDGATSTTTNKSWTWKHTLLIGVVTLAAGISGYEIHDKIK